MKRLYLLVFTVILLMGIITISSCSKKNIKSNTGYTEVQIPKSLIQSNNLKSSSVFVPKDERVVKESFVLYEGDTAALNGTQIITLDEYGNMIKLEISNNIFNESSLTPNFLQKYEELNSQKTTGFKSSKNVEDIGTCLKACGSVKHPGWCKAGCWAELAIKAAAVVVAVIAAT